jgi:hypothetical protein
MSCLLCLLPAVGHDQLWCLYVAQRMLHGVKLYGPELLESNPPLIMWMLLLPATVARLFHLPVTLAFKGGILLLQAGCALVCLRLIRRVLPELTRASLWWLGFAFIAVTGAMPVRDFGQREHLLVLLCLPYVLAAALDGQALGIVARIGIGVAAGLGFSLKPHQLLVPVAVEVALLALRGRRGFRLRAEAVSLLATCLVYLAAIRMLTPSYITDIVPILRGTYWAIGHLSFGQVVGEAVQLHILAAIAIGVYFFRSRGDGDRLVAVLLVAGVASTVAYYVQGTGWYYQQIPALSFFGFALAVEAIGLVERWRVRLPGWAPVGAAGLCVLAVGLTAYASGYTLAQPLSFPSGLSDVPDPSFFAGLPAGTPVAILTTVVDDSVPPIATHRLLWAQRENNLWTLPAILRNETPMGEPARKRIPPVRLAELDRMQHQWMVEDLARWRPALILVARCQDPAVHCQILEDRHDDLLAWFGRDAEFRAAFGKYHYVRSSGMYDAYVPN